MVGITSRNWWIIALKGIASITLGIITITSQHMMAGKFVSYFAYLLFCLGVLGLYISVTNMVKSATWSLWFVEGLGSILLAIVSLIYRLPISAFLLDLIIGLWLLIVCVQPIVFIFRFFRQGLNYYSWIYGILLFLFAVILIYGFILRFFSNSALYGNVSSYMVAGIIVSIYGTLTLLLSLQYRKVSK